MKSTSCGCNCPYVKQGFCESEKECPNYIETWWQEGQSQEPVLIKDCAPKRMILQQQILQYRVETMQQSLNQYRNESLELRAVLNTLINASKDVIKGVENEKINAIGFYDADSSGMHD